MMIRWQEHCEQGDTDGRTEHADRRTDGRTEVFLELLGHSQKYWNTLLSTENCTYVIPYVLSMDLHCNECQGTPDNIGLAYGPFY